MLTLEQNREYNRCKKLQDFLIIHTNIFSGFVPFAAEAERFAVNFTGLETLLPNKNVVTNGITTDKRGLKQKIAKAVALICRKTMAYANSYNNPELAAQTDTREDIVFKMKDASLPAYVQSIKNLVEPLLTNTDYTPYGVTQAALDALLADAQNFNSMIGVADVMASGNTVANTAINNAIDKLRLNIKQFDLLVDEFEQSNPQFVQGYHINSAVDNTGTRHSGIEGRVVNQAGAAISNAMVELQGTTKKAFTDLNGFYRLDRVRTDDYNVICSATGYTAKTVVHYITRGRIDELNFVL